MPTGVRLTVAAVGHTHIGRGTGETDGPTPAYGPVVGEMSAADQWRARLRQALTASMRERQASAVKGLRSTLAAIDNAEAVDGAHAPVADSGAIPGAVVGLGAGEVARRQLGDEDVRAIIEAEIAERLAAADHYESAGQPGRAAQLRDEATAIEVLYAGP